jgi:transposase
MRFIGLDLHKHTLEVCALDRRGKVLFRESVTVRREALEAFAWASLKRTDRLAVEATTNTWSVADILRPFVAGVTVANPLQVKAIAQAKVKTDKIDAEVLANLLRCEYLPEVWVPDAATQKLRQLTTLRSAVVTDRSRLKNRVQSLLAQLLVVPPVKVLFTAAGLEWLRAVDLPADARATVDLYLRLYEAVDQELRRIDDQLMALAYADDRAKLLMTLPGIAHGVAVSLLAALGDVSRFPDGDHAAGYLGLTPSTRQSGPKCYHGRITKAGCPQTRAMLVQAVQAASDHPGPIGAFFRRLRKRKKYNVAVIATARKLVTIAYLMLKNNEPYRYAKPELVKGKLDECQRKAGQVAPARERPASPAADRLNEVYRSHGLPASQAPAEWSTGERRGFADSDVAGFAEEVHGPRGKAAKPRRKAKPKVKA